MAGWTLLNPPPWRSKDNQRAGIPGEMNPNEPHSQFTPEEMSKRNLNQPPLFLILKRTGPTTLELTNAVTNEVIYRIHDTGRNSFSSKPDYEIFRPSAGDLFVGSVRVGIRGTEVKLPLTGKKLTDIEKFTSQTQKKLKWNVTHIGRQKNIDRTKPGAIDTNAEPAWIVVLDCVDENDLSAEQDPVCTVKLFDGLPNGRFEIWDKDACADVGGSWDYLDELVTVAYANMEKSRRKVIKGPDPTAIGLAGIGMSAGGMIT